MTVKSWIECAHQLISLRNGKQSSAQSLCNSYHTRQLFVRSLRHLHVSVVNSDSQRSLKPASKSADMNTFRNEIRALRCQNIERRHFIPQKALYTVLSLENVRIVLKDQGIEKEQLEELAQNITQGKRAIFGILVCIRQVRSILKFVEIDRFQYQPSHLDHTLPLSKEDLGKVLFSPVAEEFHE